MIEKRVITINDIESILKTHYGYNSVSIERIRSGIKIDDMTSIDLGPGGTLDIFLEVNDGKEEKGDSFSFNVVDRIGNQMAKQTERITALEWVISDIQKQLFKCNKRRNKEKPVEINPDPDLELKLKLT